jgi:VWFA-related protein
VHPSPVQLRIAGVSPAGDFGARTVDLREKRRAFYSFFTSSPFAHVFSCFLDTKELAGRLEQVLKGPIKMRIHRELSPRRLTACLLGCLAFQAIAGFGQQATPTPASAQQPAPAEQKPSFSVQVKVVNVPATVRDKHGQIVRGLTKDDFVLEEDGRPQTIHYFSLESDLPLTVGLLVDTSFSQRRVMDQERRASYTFLDRMVRQDKDAAFIIHFDHEVELLQDLTNSRQKLQSALNSLQVAQPGDRNSGSGGGSSPTGYPGGRGGGRRGGDFGHGTLLYDAVFLASDELMKKQQGRKALIILSDGVDRGSKEGLEAAVEAAQRADTIVYAILFKDDEGFNDRGFGGFGGGMGRRGPYGGGGRRPFPREERPDGKKVLERISKQTGGRMFEVSSKHNVEKIYAQIEDELRGQYSLGYTPDRKDSLSGYHRIHLTVKKKDLTVQARDGYYVDR